MVGEGEGRLRVSWQLLLGRQAEEQLISKPPASPTIQPFVFFVPSW